MTDRPVAQTMRTASGFVLRTPLLPFDTLTRWGAEGPDRASARRYLLALLEDPVVREALFVASPDLARAIPAWIAKPDGIDAQATERALVRYLSRMSSRATPFGLFSSVGTGSISGPTQLQLGAHHELRRHTRLDTDYLFGLCADLGRDPAIRREQTFFPNSSLYVAAARLRYAEARIQDRIRRYHLVAVDPSSYLDEVLARARGGATIEQLIEVLCTDPEITRTDAEVFIEELIATQLLVSTLQPQVTGREPTIPLAEQLECLTAGRPAAAALRDAARAIAQLDAAPLGLPPAPYLAIADDLAARLPTKVEANRLFQIDLVRDNPDLPLQLGPRLVQELQRGAQLLSRIDGAPDDDSWARFRARFVERYETREVPLLQVLDAETGIGLGDEGTDTGAPLLADLRFPGRPAGRQVTWGRREQWMLELIARAERTGQLEIELTEHDLEQLETPPHQPPSAVTMTAMIAARSAEAIDAGEFTVRLQALDRGARMLGRFCHASARIAALTAEILRVEEAERPEVIYAEIVHLPGGRVGNILLRPVLRSHEIAYLGLSGAPPDRQISIDDLVVSIAGSRVVLRSRSLDKEVIPRMTTAHNTESESLAVYRFLCRLAEQYGREAYWSWGALADAPFLPRLRSGRIVLSRARWRLGKTELETFSAASKGAKSARSEDALETVRARQASAVAALRERRGLPRWIAVIDRDNELVVDLDNPLMVDSFVHLIKEREVTTVCELFPDPEHLCVRGEGGGFCHELQVPLYRDAALPAVPRAVPRASESARRFAPGSPWLYLKVYCGPSTADLVLREAVAPLVREVIAAGHARSWFFLRYADPATHLRIRFFGDPARLLAEVMPRAHAAFAPMLESGILWRVQVDSYDREIERYGGPAGIELAERLFAADSDAVLAIVETGTGDAALEAAWRLALRGIDQLLADLGCSAEAKLRIVTRLREDFGHEHGLDTAGQRRLGEKFRKHRVEIAELLSAAPPASETDDHPLAPGLVAFARRSQMIAPLATELQALAQRGGLTSTIEDLASSFVHMHVNRILTTAHRQQELVLYDLLRRHYDGLRARTGPRPEAPGVE